MKDKDNIQLTDIIDTEALQKLQDAFAKAFKMPSVIYDQDGKAITKPSCFTEFCSFVRSTKKGKKNCEAFDAKLIEQLKHTDKPLIRQGCALKNIITAAISIKINNRHLANFGIGQIIDGPLNEEEVKNYAAQIEVDEDILLRKAKTLIPKSLANLEDTIEFLSVLTEQISEMGFRNLENKRLLEKHIEYEKQLAEQNHLLNLTFENDKVARWVWNYETEKVDFSPSKARMLGYRPEEFPNDVYKITALIHKDDYENAMQAMTEHLTGKKAFYETIYRIKTKEGKYNYCYDYGKIIERDSSGKPKKLIGIIFNIDNQKRYEKQLLTTKDEIAKSEYKVRGMFENTQMGILFCSPSGEVLEANKAILDILGSPSLEATQQINLLNFKPLIDVGFSAEVKKCIDKQITVTGDTVYISKWGKEVYMKYQLIPLIINTELFGIWINLNNLSDLWHVQKELINAKEKAEESDALKSAFLRNISHEVRTPMNAITGFSDLLLKPDLEAEKREKFTNIIHESLKKLLDTIENAITIAHIETKQLQVKEVEFSPEQLIEEIYNEYIKLQPKINKSHINFSYRTQPIDQTINSDYTRLHQIFCILLDNSFKFTQKGKIEIGYSLKIDGLEFFVKDTGIGIPKQNQDIIFKSFAQADEKITQLFGGAGLGLSIAVGLIKLMKGELSIISDENEGTEIKFCIPISKSKEIEKKPNQTHKPNNEIVILIAEDEEFNFLYIEELLSTENYNLVHAKNGKIALEYFKKHSIDLIFMDIKMPVMDGFEATKAIRKQNREIPIIAQTAFSYKREDCLNAGFTDYIAKPFNDEQLLNKLKQYV